MPGLQHSQLHIQAGSPGNPNQWSITCQSQWWMPAPLAVTVLDPGAWFPSMSWQRLSWSSVHLHTGSSVAHSQLVRTRRGRGAGQERPSAISALQLLPSFPYLSSPSLILEIEKERNTHWCVPTTVLDTNPKHSTLWAAMKKINSTPARVFVRGCWQLVTSGPQPAARLSVGKAGHTGHPGR